MTAREQCMRCARRARDLYLAADLESERIPRLVLLVRARVAYWISGYWAARVSRELP